MDLHPSRNIIALGLIDGSSHIFELSNKQNRNVVSTTSHKGSVTDVQFTQDGSHLYTVSSDKAFQCFDINTANHLFRKKNAHACGITRVYNHENFVFTGDDEGTIKVWDIRDHSEIKAYKPHQDYISDFAIHGNKLLASSADGTMSLFDLEKGSLAAQSGNIEDELLSIVVMKDGKKVICGSQGGILDIFSWGEWEDISDRFPGHPESVDALVKLDEDVVFTGSSDGLIRVVEIHPNQLLGVIGGHDFPIERMLLSHDKRLLASASHDNTVKFWNLSFMWDEAETPMEETPKTDQAPPSVSFGDDTHRQDVSNFLSDM
eukprot:TRINITY_DN7031_c0_g1_i1.p1 TRINITY_DN7031_c0_g1~~TRINITY_DN7031_c0_g1_i1.p1  ORF type:complete len:318 (-),score=67.10 TRINITY_DN7031_c0_g1_i1:125-1078(-)